MKSGRQILLTFFVADECREPLMDLAHDAMTRVVAFTVDTQVILVAEVFLIDVAATGDVTTTFCNGKFCRSAVQVVNVVSLKLDTGNEFEGFDFVVRNLLLVTASTSGKYIFTLPITT